MEMKTLQRLACGLAAALACSAAFAQSGAALSSYPSKPIRLITPFNPGGAIDIYCRLVAEPLSRRLGQNIVVEAIAGANTIVGTQALVRSAPDGHTFMITTIQTTGLGLYTILNKKQTIFPAWAGWCTIAVGITFIPLVLMPFVSDGPFTVNGTWNFWIVFSVWLFAFFTPYSYFMIKHLSRKSEAPALSAAHSH